MDEWSGDTAKRIANEFEMSPGETGIVEARLRGAEPKLRLRTPADLVSIGRLPDDVQGLFTQDVEPTIEDVRPHPVRDVRFAAALAEALRFGRLMNDDRTLLVTPLYQGGRSIVFAGLAIRPVEATADEPSAASVLVKIAVGLRANAVSIHEATLDNELRLLEEFAGWPGLPVTTDKRQIVVSSLLPAMRRHGIHLGSLTPAALMPALIIKMGHPRTVESAPRLLCSVIDDTTAPMRRRTRRDLHNILVLAEQLGTLTRLLHIRRRAHRHLSAHAIVVRYEVGILEHVLAADLAASVVTRTDSDDLLYRDLFDLGAVLVQAISSVPLAGDRQDFQPPSFAGRALIKRAVEGEGETVLRLLFAIGRYLLETSQAADGAGQASPTVHLLDHFLEEIAHIKMLYWSRARGVPERRVSSSIVSAGALPSSTAHPEGLARSAADPVAARLITISHLVSLETLYDWCKRYVTNWWRESISSAGEARTEDTTLGADQCITILRQGYGRSAGEEMWKHLWNEKSVNWDNFVRVLRNYVTLWIREDRFDVPHESEDGKLSEGLADELDRLQARLVKTRLASSSGLQPGEDAKREIAIAWIDEFKRRIADKDDGTRPNPRTIDDTRIRSWMQAAMLRNLLRNQLPPTEKDIHELEVTLRGRNSPETVFWHILLARAWVAAAADGFAKSTNTESGWDKAMRTLLVAAGVAAARQLPFEMAGTLSASAYLTRIALSTSRLRAELVKQGADEDSVRVQAAECALMAGDAYLWLDAQTRHCRSVLEAAWLLQGSAFPERLIQAFQLLALARNNRLLDWRPPHLSDNRDQTSATERSFVRYPPRTKGPSDAIRFTDLEQQLFNEIHEAWAKTRGRIQTTEDPGTALEHGWFSRYTSSIQSIFGPGGPQIELKRSGHLHEDDAPRGGAVRRLLRCAAEHYRRQDGSQPAELVPGRETKILDFGCGGGEEAWDLARDHTVWAVDSPVWFAGTRPEMHGDDERRARLKFLAFDPVDYAQRILDGNPPDDSPSNVDVVLFRCSLCRVSRRDKLLKAAFNLLKEGGFVLATDWIQTRTTDRITWSRLLNTMRFVDLETHDGYKYLCKDLGKKLSFVDFHAWQWEEVAAGDEPPMYQFFRERLEDTMRKLASEDVDHPRRPHARTALLQAQRDLEILTAMSTRQGPLGWLFWAARRPQS